MLPEGSLSGLFLDLKKSTRKMPNFLKARLQQRRVVGERKNKPYRWCRVEPVISSDTVLPALSRSAFFSMERSHPRKESWIVFFRSLRLASSRVRRFLGR